MKTYSRTEVVICRTIINLIETVEDTLYLVFFQTDARIFYYDLEILFEWSINITVALFQRNIDFSIIRGIFINILSKLFISIQTFNEGASWMNVR